MSIPLMMATYFMHRWNSATENGKTCREVSTLTFQSLLRVHLHDSSSNSLQAKCSKLPSLYATHIIRAIHL